MRPATTTTTTTTDHDQALILKAAIGSRLLLLALIIICRTLIHPYDTSSPLNPPCLSSSSSSSVAAASGHHPHQDVLLPRIASAIQNSVVWDSVYFVRIAQCGYEYEQSFAFLPLLPFSISLLSRTVFAPLVPVIGLRAVLALAGYVLNNVVFVLAAVYFYRLSVIILKDHPAALRASMLFCFNPASIFYSSIYSESLYALFTLGGVYHSVSGANNIAVLWFSLSGCARSNGVLNAGYFCFQTMHQAYDAVFLKRRAFLAAQVLVVGALRCLFTFLPFIAFQAYGYYNMCLGRSLEEMRPWCKAKVPLLYNYIQSHYWGVGFLRYFQAKQLPNFLLASPILSLSLCSLIHYVRSQPESFLLLGFRAYDGKNGPVASLSSQVGDHGSNSAVLKEKSSAKMQENQSLRQRKQKLEGDDCAVLSKENVSLEEPGCLSSFIVPCTLHLAFMAATAFFVMHVQVATRFLSASPPLYWFASYLMVCPGSNRWGYMIRAYSAAYILLGSLLFSNFYPFT